MYRCKQKLSRYIIIVFVLLSFKGIAQNKIIANGCLPSTSQAELNINNVRTTILAGGDMWWNLDNGQYEVPKGYGRHSMFAGALWIGGLDDQGNLKVAGMTYRQDGNDFWPGPLNANPQSPNYGTTDSTTCSDFNRHWSIYKSDVIEYKSYLDCINDINCDENIAFNNYSVPEAIESWPANYINQDGELSYLAPFRDENGDGEYTPGVDYPEYNLDGNVACTDENTLFGHQSIWWVFNDNGNIHTETGSESAIGLEIQAQAFAFNAGIPLNNMTFYNYKMINRSTSVLNNTYFGQWVDPDIGNYQDDYVGCDVSLGLGYCYNGDADDEGAYGYNYDSDYPPPAIGVDFFRGPLADIGDGIDNDQDGEIDEPGEQIIMSKFVYYNNDFSDHGNPENATHYYGYLRGIWKDGQPMTYGGTGWESSNPECNFMFPGTTDPSFSEEWTEITAGNYPADRRFLQSAGPFTLEPGAVNYITTGVVWARANEGNNFNSVELLKQHDQFAQELFDICFDESQADPAIVGCTNPDAINYDPYAIYEDGSCLIEGCTDSEACNFNYLANIEDNSCKYCQMENPYPVIGVFKMNESELISSNIGDSYMQWYGESTITNDLDEDGNLDNIDIDIDGNGFLDDIDGDGVLNGYDSDIDGDGILDIYDIDLNLNGVVYEEFFNYDYSGPDGPNETIESLKIYDQCLSSGDTCPSNPEFLINNLSLDALMNVNENVSNSWIKPISDRDDDAWQWFPIIRPQNWIRSGTVYFSNNNSTLSPFQHYGDIGLNGYPIQDNSDIPLDPQEIFEYNGNAWLVPYKLVSSDYKGHTASSSTNFANEINSIDTIGGGLAWYNFKNFCTLDSLFNVDIILTPDKSLWTRCPVLDMSEVELTWTGSGFPYDNNMVPIPYWPSGDEYGAWEVGDGTGEHGERKWDLRLDLNVDKYGYPDDTGDGFNSENGWGWFPGYAINTTTGERLNLMFSENSSLGELHNANDMVFNPTPYIYDFGIDNENPWEATISTMNGGHAVFVLDTEYQGDNHEDNPHYASYVGSSPNNAWNNLRKSQVIRHIQWVGNWLSSETSEWLSEPIIIQARIEGRESEGILNEDCQCICFGDDADGDSVCDDVDNCEFTYNPTQVDSDNDGFGDECDPTPYSVDELFPNREIINSFDILGRQAGKRGYKIEIYDDGTVEKKYILNTTH